MDPSMLRSPSPAYSIASNDSDLSNISLDDAKAVLATAKALIDEPRLGAPAEPPLEPESPSSSTYSSDAEDPYDIPRDEYDTTYPDQFTCYETADDAKEALQKWARDIGYEDKGASTSHNKRVLYRECGKSFTTMVLILCQLYLDIDVKPWSLKLSRRS